MFSPKNCSSFAETKKSLLRVCPFAFYFFFSTSGVDDGLRRSWALYWAATRPDCALYCNHDEVGHAFGNGRFSPPRSFSKRNTAFVSSPRAADSKCFLVTSAVAKKTQPLCSSVSLTNPTNKDPLSRNSSPAVSLHFYSVTLPHPRRTNVKTHAKPQNESSSED